MQFLVNHLAQSLHSLWHCALDEAPQEHSAKGYEVTEPNGLPGTAPNYYFVKDPDGYKVEVIREK